MAAVMTMNLAFRPRLPAEPLDAMDIDHDLDLALAKPPCLFLLLPAELRNLIYRLVLTSSMLPDLRKLIARNHCTSSVLTKLQISPNLLSTCRQIYNEAMPILYTSNTFSASPTRLTSMPFLLDPSRPICSNAVSKRIRKWYVHVRLDCEAQFSEDDATLAFSGADELEVEVSQSLYRGASVRNVLLFKSVRGVKKANVWGSLDDDFAEWLNQCMMAPLGFEMPEYFEAGENFNPWLFNR